MTGVGAEHHDAAVPADDLAVLAHGLDTRSDLHGCSLLLAVSWGDSAVPERDPASAEVVGGELDLDPVAGEDADVVHAHLPGDVGEDLVAVLELHLEHGVRQTLEDRSFEDDRIFLGLCQRSTPPDVGEWMVGAGIPR